MSTTHVLAAAMGSACAVAMDPVPPLLVPQCSSCSVRSVINEDCEEEVLAESVNQITLFKISCNFVTAGSVTVGLECMPFPVSTLVISC